MELSFFLQVDHVSKMELKLQRGIFQVTFVMNFLIYSTLIVSLVYLPKRYSTVIVFFFNFIFTEQLSLGIRPAVDLKKGSDNNLE